MAATASIGSAAASSSAPMPASSPRTAIVCAIAVTSSPPSTTNHTTHIQNMKTGTSPSEPYSRLMPKACWKYAASAPFSAMIATLAKNAPIAAERARTRPAGTTR